MTSTEVAIRQPAAVATLGEKIEYATELAKSDLLPKQYKDKPANILLIMEYGDYLGIPPVAALRLIHVIDNKPVASAELIAGRVRAAGHRMRVTYDQSTRTASCSIWRSDDPGFAFRSEWSWERANAVRDRDGVALTAKLNWRNYYPAMLKWRATTECARDACPEILLGVSYMPDELGEAGITDAEADEIGVMTTAQRVEHAEIRRMNEPAPGAVEKLPQVPDDDPWYQPETSGPVVPDEARGSGPVAGPEQHQQGEPVTPAALGLLFDKLELDDEERLTVLHWLCGGDWAASRAQIRNVTTSLQDFLHAAGDDSAAARAALWAQYRKVHDETDADI